MKMRAAIKAALVILVIFTVVAGFNLANLPDRMNEQISNALEQVGALAGKAMTSMTAEERAELLQGDVLSRREALLTDADGATVFASSQAMEGISIPDSSNTGKVVTADGVSKQYAIYRFDDGAFLLLCTKSYTIWTVLRRYPNYYALLLTPVLMAAIFLYVEASISKRQRFIKSVMTTLDNFSEGNFEDRITLLPELDQEAVEYNATLERLQMRIFRQQKRNQVLGALMNQMQHGIIAVDGDLKVTLITPVAKELLGVVGPSEGKVVTEISHDVKLDEIFTEGMQQCGIYTNEVAARTTVGRGHRPLRLYVSPLRRDNAVVGALALVEDITELKRMEEMRVDFAASVSHELKTPLTSIRGFVETLEAGAIDNPEMAHKFLRIIMLETERLTRLINDILSISKLESGTDTVEIANIRLDKFAYDICNMMELHAAENKVTLNYHLNDDPIYIAGNADRVEQLFINLIENAIKYNKEGGSVTVQVLPGQTHVNVSISDTGIGIPEECIPRVFERFYRVDKGRSRKMGGTGLGLAIVKHIVSTMGGMIEVQSRLGEGTEFLITLPRVSEQPNTGEVIAEVETKGEN